MEVLLEVEKPFECLSCRNVCLEAVEVTVHFSRLESKS